MSTSKGTDESLRIEQFQNYINPFNIYAEIFYQQIKIHLKSKNALYEPCFNKSFNSKNIEVFFEIFTWYSILGKKPL